MELFAAQGYQHTSLREIAERLGLSKAAVLYHFPAKDQLLAALTEPLLEDMEAALDRAAAARPPAEPRWTCVEGLLDSYLANRTLLLMLRNDLSILTRSPERYERFFDVYTRAYELIAGPGAELPALVRAAQALSALGDPLFTFPDAPNEVLREIVLDGARALLRDDDGGARRHPGRVTGRRASSGAGRRTPRRRAADVRRRRAQRGRDRRGGRRLPGHPLPASARHRHLWFLSTFRDYETAFREVGRWPVPLD